jgi:hypothetical protein
MYDLAGTVDGTVAGAVPMPVGSRAGAGAEGAESGATAGAEASTGEAVSSSGTGTNVQEAGVDEPDRAKTDGDIVVHLRGQTLVVTDVSGAEPREVGTLRLPQRLGAAELLLSGDRVLVVGSSFPLWGRPIPVDVVDGVGRILPPMPMDGTSRLLGVSLEDPTAPRIESDQTFGGELVSARQYGDTVRLVLQTGHPTLDFVFPNRDRSRSEAKEANRRIVEESSIDDWLPGVRSGDGESAPLVDCDDVRHPSTSAEFGTLTVVTVPTEDPTDHTSTAVTAGGDTVYSSTDRLYLATTRPGGRTTDVHSFALDGVTTSYVASGRVDGAVADRWSMDEHEGRLRVAVGLGKSWSPTDNGVMVLEERGDDLVVVGSVRGLGPDEEIKSVRWFDDLAIVVTFRQTDPLYTVDLSDADDPRVLGQLKIPGFSEYLHPIGDDRLLGLGHDASDRGVVRGGQASVFDLTALDDPRRLATLGLGRHATPATTYDPRGFTWLPDRSSALVGVEQGWAGRGSMVELRVGADGSLTEGSRWPVPRWRAAEARALPLADGEVALVTGSVRVLDLT